MRCSYCLNPLPITRPSAFETPAEFCSIACESNAYAELRAEFDEIGDAGRTTPRDPFPVMILPNPKVTR